MWPEEFPWVHDLTERELEEFRKAHARMSVWLISICTPVWTIAILFNIHW